MSTATPIPETAELTGDDAREMLLEVGRARLAADAFQRLRHADGFSHARSLAFTVCLVLLEGIIGLVGLAAVLGSARLGTLVTTVLGDAVPGPAGRVLTDAVRQAEAAASAGQWVGLVFGVVGALVTGTTTMGQVERGLNRLYGLETDRPTVQKYARAFGLLLTAGVGVALGLVLLAFGSSLAHELDTGRAAWKVLRWPLGIAATIAAVALLFRHAPRRRQPGWSWLAFGSAISVAGVVLASVALGLFFSWSSSFGDTYGPLAGTVALLLWALLVSVAVLYGAAVAAELEAVRSRAHGRPPVPATRVGTLTGVTR